ncbi:unnamed protein product, partial [Closterium sp. Naga37s-1]
LTGGKPPANQPPPVRVTEEPVSTATVVDEATVDVLLTGGKPPANQPPQVRVTEEPVSTATATAMEEEAVEVTLRRAVRFYETIQAEDGHWAGGYGGPLFLMPGLLITLHVMGALDPVLTAEQKGLSSVAVHTSADSRAPEGDGAILLQPPVLTAEHKREMVGYLYNHQNPDGGWGLHIEGHSTMFGSTLNYVLGVYDYRGINLMPPEMWLLPYFLPVHPGRMWCHCRMMYLPMCYIYGLRAHGPTDTPLVAALSEELYNEPCLQNAHFHPSPPSLLPSSPPSLLPSSPPPLLPSSPPSLHPSFPPPLLLSSSPPVLLPSSSPPLVLPSSPPPPLPSFPPSLLPSYSPPLVPSSPPPLLSPCPPLLPSCSPPLLPSPPIPQEDLYFPHPFIQDCLWGRPIGPVNKVINMLCCWPDKLIPFMRPLLPTPPHSSPPFPFPPLPPFPSHVINMLCCWVEDPNSDQHAVLLGGRSQQCSIQIQCSLANSSLLCSHSSPLLLTPPLSQVINMLCCWVEDPNSEAFKKHLPRVPDYLWLAEDGMKMQGYNGSQLWDTAFAVQALHAAHMMDETHRALKIAHSYLERSQVQEDCPSKLSVWFHHISIGAPPISTFHSSLFSSFPYRYRCCHATSQPGIAHLGGPSAPPGGRGHSRAAVVRLCGRHSLLPGQSVVTSFSPTRSVSYDVILSYQVSGDVILSYQVSDDVILSYQNKDGGMATYENTRSYPWLELRGVSMCMCIRPGPHSVSESTLNALPSVLPIALIFTTPAPPSYVQCSRASVQALTAFSRACRSSGLMTSQPDHPNSCSHLFSLFCPSP